MSRIKFPKVGIYVITNKVNGHRYIGSSINIQERWRDHKRKLHRNANGTPALQNAWNKHGEGSFEFSIIELVDDASKLIEREQYYIDLYIPEYNAAPNAGGTSGYKFSEGSREKLRKRVYSLEIREKISRANRGRKLSDETRAKMSATRSLPEVKERMRKVRLAQAPMSEESRRKLSESQKIAQNRPEVIEKQRKAQAGKIISQETRLKRSQKLKGLKRTPEQIERIRQAQLRPEVQAIKREKQQAYWQRRKALESEGGDL